MTLRVLTRDDASAYRDLRLRALREWPPAFGTPVEEEERMSLGALSERLVESKDRCLLGAFEGRALVGSIRLSRYDASNECHLAYLAGFYVIPERRRFGHGRALATQAITRARLDGVLRRLNLTVVSQQKSAIALYESLGFVPYGIEKEAFHARGLFYDEILMTLALSPPPGRYANTNPE